jgi:hypothetical protein
MGHGFSFLARQMRISTETSHFYLDLVFYNYLLKCFVILDLKTTKLSHQDGSQMDLYVGMFDDLKRGPDDNPTIGIILCSDKEETVVHYSVLKGNEQLFASKYRTLLPTEEELATEIERERLLTDDCPDQESYPPSKIPPHHRLERSRLRGRPHPPQDHLNHFLGKPTPLISC